MCDCVCSTFVFGECVLACMTSSCCLTGQHMQFCYTFVLACEGKHIITFCFVS